MTAVIYLVAIRHSWGPKQVIKPFYGGLIARFEGKLLELRELNDVCSGERANHATVSILACFIVLREAHSPAIVFALPGIRYKVNEPIKLCV